MGWKGVWVCMTKEASERRCGVAEEGGVEDRFEGGRCKEVGLI